MTGTAGPERPEGDLESYVPGSPSPARRRRRRGATVAATLGVTVALVAGVFALATLTSDGGNGTPESAVRKLIDAAADQDVLGAMEALVPAERAVLRDRLADIAGELGRLGILDDKLDLGSVPGADVVVDGLELRSEALSPDVASVLITGGRAGLTVVQKDLPLGPLVRRSTDGSDGTVVPSVPPADLGDDELRLVAVRDGGDWFVSLGYTVAEWARRSGGGPVPDFDRGVAAKGEASPEGAVRELARAVTAFDARRLVELTAPGEAAALHAYAPLFLDGVDKAAGGLRSDGVKATIDALEVSTRGSGDEAHVTVDRLTVGITTDDGLSTFAYDGRCARYDAPDDPGAFELCSDDPLLGPLSGTPFAGSTFTVVRRGGAWFLSPVGTYLDSALVTLRSLDRAEVARAISEDGGVSLAGLANPFTSFFFGGFLRETAGEDMCIVEGAGTGQAPVSCEKRPPPETAVATTAPVRSPAPSSPTVTPGAGPASTALTVAPPVPGSKATSSTSDPTMDPPALPLRPSFPPSTTNP